MSQISTDSPPDEPLVDSGQADIVVVFEVPGDEDDADERLIGRVRIHGDGQLQVIEADAGRDRFLREVVARVNAKSQLTLMAQEPPDQPFATHIATVSRDQPEFPLALLTYLRTYYGLRLV
jgi:hypothetical protein